MTQHFNDPNNTQEHPSQPIKAIRFHAYPIGSLVEREDGTKMYMVYHARGID